MSLVGAEAARAWGQEGFAAQALALARNASWWNELKRLNVPFDPNSFAHADAVPALVGGGGLDLALSFCADYALPASTAHVLHVENLLLGDSKCDAAMRREIATSAERSEPETVARLMQRGVRVILVSSGAVGCGRGRLRRQAALHRWLAVCF